MSEDPKERANLWLDHGRPDRAEKELREALAQDPEDPSTLVLLSVCLSALERETEALAAAENAIALAPDWAPPHLARAHALVILERGADAEASARLAISLDPEGAGAYATLAASFALRSKWLPCLEAAEEGLELDPEEEQCANMRAVALIQLGRAEEATFALEAALQRDPDNPDTHRNLGWKALHAGEAHDAIVHYREALRLDPDDEGAREGLVEALKARNIVYRVFLRFFLFLTKLEPKTVMLLFVGTVVARMLIKTLARSVPTLAPVLWPIFWCIVAFVMMTWIAAPLFNSLLLLDREGRYALSAGQKRQCRWLMGTAALAAVFVVLGFLGVPAAFMAALIVGVLVIPISVSFEPGVGPQRVVRGLTLALILVGATVIALDFSVQRHRERARVLVAELPEGVTADLELPSGVSLPPEQKRQLVEVAAEIPVMKSRRATSATLLAVFAFGFVAFTWIASSLAARDS